jgi:hypothetical protein
VTVEDEEGPEISDLPDLEAPNDPGECGATVTWEPPPVEDNCELGGLTSSHSPGDFFPVGPTEVIYTATDVHGNTTYEGFTVTVLDTDPPDLVCPEDIQVNINDPVFMLTGASPQGGNYSGPGVINCEFNPSEAGLGEHLITYTYENPSSGCLYSCEFFITVTGGQIIEVPMGWSGISTFVDPETPAMDDILAPILNELVILKNNVGMYYPAEGINTLGDWNLYLGYEIKVAEPVTLTVDGVEIVDKTLLLNDGWTTMPVLTSNQDVAIEALFAEVADDFIIAKDVAGTGIYWFDYGINTIGNITPGRSYHVKMLNPGEINFDIQPAAKAGLQKQPQIDSPWNEVITSPSSHVIAILPAGEILMENDVIGGFTVDGLCGGYARIKNSGLPVAITLFGKVEQSGNPPAFEAGGIITYRLYRPETDENFELEVNYDPELNQGYFESNGLSVATPVKLAPLSILSLEAASISIYPNPNDGTFTIEGISEEVNINIYNGYGEVILNKKTILPGKFSISESPGMYIIEIITKKGGHYGKLIVK